MVLSVVGHDFNASKKLVALLESLQEPVGIRRGVVDRILQIGHRRIAHSADRRIDRRTWHCLRRHRDEPPLRAEGGRQSGECGRCPDAPIRARHRIADPLVAHSHHLTEICDFDLSRGQSGRRRGARHARPGTWRSAVLMLGLLGAALLYGDGAITPAISVLSAVEGLKVDAPSLAPAVIPITVVILLGLFLAQSHGTGLIGSIFGPIMLAWFVVSTGRCL